MKLSNKDYAAIATALRDAAKVYIPDKNDPVNQAFATGKRAGVYVAAEFIADYLGSKNPNFERNLFIASITGGMGIVQHPPKAHGKESIRD